MDKYHEFAVEMVAQFKEVIDTSKDSQEAAERVSLIVSLMFAEVLQPASDDAEGE